MANWHRQSSLSIHSASRNIHVGCLRDDARAPRDRKQCRRQSEKRAPLQVSQTGRWETEANGSRREEEEGVREVVFAKDTNWSRRWEAILAERHRVAMVPTSGVASKIAIKRKLLCLSSVTSARVSSADPIKKPLSSWREFPPSTCKWSLWFCFFFYHVTEQREVCFHVWRRP